MFRPSGPDQVLTLTGIWYIDWYMCDYLCPPVLPLPLLRPTGDSHPCVLNSVVNPGRSLRFDIYPKNNYGFPPRQTKLGFNCWEYVENLPFLPAK